MIPDRLRGETPFPQAGDGVSLQFRNSELLSLQNKFGVDWLNTVETRILGWDSEFLFTLIKTAAKKGGKPFAVDIDAIEAPVNSLKAPVLDALFISLLGKTFQEYLEESIRDMKDRTAKGELPLAEPSAPEDLSAS